MRKLAFLIIPLVMITLCVTGCKDEGKTEDNMALADLRFHDELRLKTTPVKDQGNSSLCWVYAMLATIETEHAMRGDSINLSTDHPARSYLMEQVMTRAMTNTRTAITTRGMAPMLIDLLMTYGEHHHSGYNSQKANYNIISRKLSLMTNRKMSAKNTEKGANHIFDDLIGYRPKVVFMDGAEYTPLEFAHSVCMPDEYVAVTSFTHHPFGQKFTLEVKDNYFHSEFLNIPIDTLISHIEKSLKHGHPVCWEGDISEDGFSWRQGVGILSDTEETSQEARQKAFENHETTDDHCMAIIGIAKDQHGDKYFICKNSWGTDNKRRGYVYLSYDYVRLKTICVVMQEEEL
ncbi:MAG: cysteine protease [Prevotella sp.]|nr:cysteine protease [Prevotella sp.]